jgi:ribosomal protein S12 methylthiotransferase
MRGDYSSRSIPVLLKEAAFLVEKGVKEISLVAQDITLYGKDLYGRESLTKLLQELVKIEGLEWVRLLYCYPTHISDELIDLIARERKICKYLDIPLQHADQEILNKMGRKQKTEKVVELIQKLRKKIPDLALRTTFIVGFPGEREQHFATLLKFMKEVEFDWAGVFTYSPEEGTPAAEFPEQVPEEIKEERYHRAMLLQREITSRRNVRWLGQSLTVLIEKAAREQGKGIYQGRTQHQAPEVDGVVFFKGCDLNPGEFVPVSVTGVEDYDLLGESKA